MKKILFLLLLSHVFLTTQAQNTFPPSGNAGIGTTSPDGQLTLFGTSGEVKLHLGNSSLSGYTAIRFAENATGYGVTALHRFNSNYTHPSLSVFEPSTIVFWEGVGNMNLGAKGNYKLYTGGLGVEYERMRITENGQVGIGTSSPWAQLHLSGPSNQSGLYVQHSDSWIGHSSGANYFRGNTIFAELDANSKVGIGTNSPDSKLTIAGSDEDNIRLGVNGSNGQLAFLGDAGGGSDGQLGLYSSSGGNLSVLLNGSNHSYINTNGNFGIGTDQPDVKLSITGLDEENINLGINGTHGRLAFIGDTGDGSDGQLGLYSSSGGNLSVLLNGTNDSYINTNGNFGIGTDQPDSKLTVNGGIHTKEVRVDLNGILAPDFVFEEDYDLKSLEETEKYIQANKHLPEIPSAAEMEENGIELKEMNLKLLQKVEELTLHLIEQNKKIELLENEVSKLKDQ